MTIRRMYYEQPELGVFDARVVSVRGVDAAVSAVVLDATAFYPEGGGQPCDLGTLAGLRVSSVTESVAEGEATVEHLVEGGEAALAAAGVSPGASVRGVVDMARRADHSEQHTAQHLLSAILDRRSGARTLSFHLGERYSSIDLDKEPLSRSEADAVEDEFMRAVREDRPVTTHLCPPEDTRAFPLRKEPTVETGVLRVVDIGGLDYSACCGTHLARTGALGLFRILKAEKYKGGSRISFLAGSRALADYRRLAGLARDAALAAAVGEDELPATMAAQRDRAKALERDLALALVRAADFEAAALDAGAPAGAAVSREADGADYAGRLARALAGLGRVALVSCGPAMKAFVASSAAADAAGTFGPLAAARGGKGGGGKTFYQAAFPDLASLADFMAEAGRAVTGGTAS